MKYLFFYILLIITAISISCRSSKKINSSTQATNQSTLIQKCPEAWYRNLMPESGKSQPTEYLIVNGVRAEIAHYDTTWIRKNCPTLRAIEVH